MTSNSDKLDLIEFKLSDEQRAFFEEMAAGIREAQATPEQIAAMVAVDEFTGLGDSVPRLKCRCYLCDGNNR